MADVPQAPRLAGGATISITRQEIYSLDCPKCRKPLNVTDLAFGTNIECPECNNVTWRPEFKPKWWFKLKNFLVSNLVSFIFGVAASITATYLLEIDFIKDSVETHVTEQKESD